MLKPEAVNEIPEATVRIARAAFPKGNRIMNLRDEFGTMYEDEDFKTLFSSTGQPALTPWRLALITVFQFLEGLSDRQAADAVRSRLDWKYALGLELEDAGFDFSVLSEFRTRLSEHDSEQLLLDKMLDKFRTKGLLKTRGKQRSDSTHILAQVRSLNRSECIIESLRAALNIVATVEPDWLKAWVPDVWFERYSYRIEEARLIKGKEARVRYLEQVGKDGFTLLDMIYQSSTHNYLAGLPVIETLRKVWLDQFWINEGVVTYREAKDLAPAGQRINSPYDPEAQFGNKRSMTWTGYKVFITETCDPDKPHVITNVITTGASESDMNQTERIHNNLKDKQLLPKEHLAAAGFVDAELMLESPKAYELELVGPIRADTSWQAKMEEAYDLSRFTINWDAELMTCPKGKESSSWAATKDLSGNSRIAVKFKQADCAQCESRQLCTRSKKGPRHLTIKAREEHDVLVEARALQAHADWKHRYKLRAGIEATMSQGVRANDLRRSRYRGLRKTSLQHVAISVAINIQRVTDWFSGIPSASTRVSRFARLAL